MPFIRSMDNLPAPKINGHMTGITDDIPGLGFRITDAPAGGTLGGGVPGKADSKIAENGPGKTGTIHTGTKTCPAENVFPAPELKCIVCNGAPQGTVSCNCNGSPAS